MDAKSTTTTTTTISATCSTISTTVDTTMLASTSSTTTTTTISTTAPITTTTATLLAAATNIAKICNTSTSSTSNNNSNSISNNNNNSSNNNNINTSSASLCSQVQQTSEISANRLDDANNLSMASSMSEGQRSRCALSGAPSASSSPILSPPTKVFGRNANGTVVATARPNNEAESQLYRVLQRASLLSYFDTLVEMGGDDVQQLYEAGEEEFLEIMSLVGMASKPLHVRRLQKALHQWSQNPAIFQGPFMYNTNSVICDTPTKSSFTLSTEPSPTLPVRNKIQTFSPTNVANLPFHPTPLLTTTQTQISSPSHFLTQMCTPVMPVPVVQQQSSAIVVPTSISGAVVPPTVAGSTAHQVSSSSPQLTPVLNEKQVLHITLGAEKIARQLPAREPRPQTSKKRTSRELEQIIAMSENDPRRMEEIRKYSAIYGRFDCKRRPEKPLTMHEVCVNEAAAQLCRLVPALLTRRDELFPLARQIVKDAGFGHSATIARYGGLLSQIQSSSSSTTSATSTQRVNIVVDCESSDSSAANAALQMKRQRLLSTEQISTPDLSRDSVEDSRYNLFAMYQKFAAKQPFDLAEMSKFTFQHKPDMEDTDSRFSFNSNSPTIAHNGSETERDMCENMTTNHTRTAEVHSTANTLVTVETSNQQRLVDFSHETAPQQMTLNPSNLAGVQVISAAAAGHIIAVANPALALSPTLNEALTMKRETDSSEL